MARTLTYSPDHPYDFGGSSGEQVFLIDWGTIEQGRYVDLKGEPVFIGLRGWGLYAGLVL